MVRHYLSLMTQVKVVMTEKQLVVLSAHWAKVEQSDTATHCCTLAQCVVIRKVAGRTGLSWERKLHRHYRNNRANRHHIKTYEPRKLKLTWSLEITIPNFQQKMF